MDASKKHILITTAWYPTDTTTSGVFVKEQGEALVRAGHRVTVLLVTYSTLLANYKQPKPNYDKSLLMNVVHLHVVFPLPGRFFSNPDSYFKKVILKRVSQWMQEYSRGNSKPDIIHHHCLSDSAYITESISDQFNIPYLFTEHSNYFKYEELNKFNKFETFEDHKRFVKKACARIAVSEVRARGYEEIFGSSFVVVSNMVQEIFEVPLMQKQQSENFTFTCVAIFDKRKRQDILIHAFVNSFKGQKVRLVLAGNGPMESEYRRLVKEEGMEGQIEILGKQGREGIVQLFDRSQVAVLSSDQETFGVVLAEAMFRGLPIISTISGGPEEIVTVSSGILCKKGNVDAMSKALETMIANYNSYSAEGIRNYARSRFSEKVIIVQLENLYMNCTGNK